MIRTAPNIKDRVRVVASCERRGLVGYVERINEKCRIALIAFVGESQKWWMRFDELELVEAARKGPRK